MVNCERSVGPVIARQENVMTDAGFCSNKVSRA
jgi:hypothetical protein